MGRARLIANTEAHQMSPGCLGRRLRNYLGVRTMDTGLPSEREHNVRTAGRADERRREERRSQGASPSYPTQCLFAIVLCGDIVGLRFHRALTKLRLRSWLAAALGEGQSWPPRGTSRRWGKTRAPSGTRPPNGAVLGADSTMGKSTSLVDAQCH